MSSPRGVLRSPGGAAAWSWRLLVGAQLALLVTCKDSRSEPTRERREGGASAAQAASAGAAATGGLAQIAPEPEPFRFVVPLAYLPHELRGEGSETVLAPRDAQVSNAANGIEVQHDDDFALQIQFQPALSALPVSAPGARRVLAENDAVVFESGQGYWFVVLRELIPEWDEADRRRVACGSAGALDPAGAGEPRRFTHAAVERMVAACRSLELPRLE